MGYKKKRQLTWHKEKNGLVFFPAIFPNPRKPWTWSPPEKTEKTNGRLFHRPQKPPAASESVAKVSKCRKVPMKPSFWRKKNSWNAKCLGPGSGWRVSPHPSFTLQRVLSRSFQWVTSSAGTKARGSEEKPHMNEPGQAPFASQLASQPNPLSISFPKKRMSKEKNSKKWISKNPAPSGQDLYTL